MAQLTLEKAPKDSIAGSGEVIKDITSPYTDLLRTEADDFIFGPATRIKFNVLEEGSGTKTTYFKVGDFPFMQSDGRQMIPHDIEEGAHQMQYYSVDKNGNQEQVRIKNIYIDKSGPVIASRFGASPVAFNEGVPVFSDNVKLKIAVADTHTQVQKITYTINNSEGIDVRGVNEIDLSEKLRSFPDGLVTVEVRAYDVFYNLSREVIQFELKK